MERRVWWLVLPFRELWLDYVHGRLPRPLPASHSPRLLTQHHRMDSIYAGLHHVLRRSCLWQDLRQLRPPIPTGFRKLLSGFWLNDALNLGLVLPNFPCPGRAVHWARAPFSMPEIIQWEGGLQKEERWLLESSRLAPQLGGNRLVSAERSLFLRLAPLTNSRFSPGSWLSDSSLRSDLDGQSAWWLFSTFSFWS